MSLDAERHDALVAARKALESARQDFRSLIGRASFDRTLSDVPAMIAKIDAALEATSLPG